MTAAPRVSVLQLDTGFARIPGDIGCAQTFRTAPEIRRIARASVARIVTADVGSVDIAPFVAATGEATGDIVTTSCGFLAPFQAALAAATARPVIASALAALPRLMALHGPAAVAVLTFDAARLTPAHLGGLHPGAVIGLPPGSHLRDIIANDRPGLAESPATGTVVDAKTSAAGQPRAGLDPDRAATEILALLRASLPRGTRALLVECTNLPPYKAAMRRVFDGEIADILTCIEAACPGAIAPAHL